MSPSAHTAFRALARNVAQLRRSAGWTQAELARRAKLSSCSVYHIESFPRSKASRHAPNLDTIARIAEALGVTPGELLSS